ncbi:MAG: aspartate-semialdehyde dehydrogenase [Spirochaetota bacterium]
MSKKLKAGIVGATGMVGQRFITLLHNHPDFEITMLAASAKSSGKSYADAVEGRWAMNMPVPESVAGMIVRDAADVAGNARDIDFTFCAVDMSKEETLALEEAYAKAEIPVVSNNSAARGLSDVPMLVPEINNNHLAVIEAQRKRLGTQRGFIAVKPNCSIQSYVPALSPLMDFGIREVVACTYQAISGAGKTFETWPEMVDNVIPFIKGEEEKSEKEPMKIWGHVEGGKIVNAAVPAITAQCIRVAASDGHMAAVFVKFDRPPAREQILERWKNFKGRPQELKLYSAPAQFINYFEEDNRPQTKLDRDLEGGMGISVGRLREDHVYDYKFVCLSHNTLRGAAGGAVLIAELLKAEGYLSAK